MKKFRHHFTWFIIKSLLWDILEIFVGFMIGFYIVASIIAYFSK